MTKLLSDRVKKIPATQVSAERYSFLKLSEAEPDLGVPAANGYVLASQTDGTRSWVTALSAVSAPGSDGQLVYNNGGSLGGSSLLYYDDVNQRLGIGTTSPSAKLDIAETWNDVGTTFTALKTNITDTASASDSKLLNLNVNGISAMSVGKNGYLTLLNSGSVSIRGIYNNGMYVSGDWRVQGDVWINKSDAIKWDAAGWPSSNTTDLVLERDAANTLGIRNSTNAQTLNVYNTYTDSSNYERGSFKWSANTLTIETESSGTGLSRGINIVPSNSIVEFGNTSSTTVTLQTPNISNYTFKIKPRGTNNAIALESSIYQTFEITDNVINGSIRFLIDGEKLAIRQAGVTFGKEVSSNIVKLFGANGDFSNDYGKNVEFYTGGAIGSNTAIDLKGGNFTFGLGRGHGTGLIPSFIFKTRLGSVRGTDHTEHALLELQEKNVIVDGNIILSDTWNDVNTTFTAIDLDVTDTASAADSKLLNLNVGSTNKFSVRKDGAFGIDQFRILPSTSLYGAVLFSGAERIRLGSSFVELNSGGRFSWSSTGNPGSPDTHLYRDAAGTLAQRNGTNAQTFNVYNTYTDSSNYERAYLKWASNVFTIGADEANGTGTSRTAQLISNGGAWNGTLAVKFPGYDTGLVLWGNDDVGIRNTGTLGFSVQKVGGQVFLTAANSLSFGNNTALSVDTGIARDSAGVLKITDGSTGTGSLVAGSVSSTDIYTNRIIREGDTPVYYTGITWGSGEPTFRATNVNVAKFGRSGTNGNLVLTGNGDVVIQSEASDVLGLRNSTNAQTFNVYNTYTDSSNYERGVFKWDTNVLTIGTEALGTGTQRNVTISSPNSVISGSTTVDLKQGNAIVRNFAGALYPASGAMTLGRTSNFWTSLFSNSIITQNTTQTSETATLATVTQTQIASFAVATYASGKFVVQAKDSVTGEVHVTELLVVHNGTTASATEYGTIHTGTNPLATYEVDINSGNVRILATAASANSTTYKVSETLITA